MKLNANRAVSGIMRGYDQFMNIVLDTAHDDKEDVELGMVVRLWRPSELSTCRHFPLCSAQRGAVGPPSTCSGTTHLVVHALRHLRWSPLWHTDWLVHTDMVAVRPCPCAPV